SGLRIIEVDVDTSAYDLGHIPGAIAWNWTTQLSDTLRRDILSQDQLEALMSKAGIKPETTVILYGDSNNWFAAWAFWQLKIYGHDDVRIMDGGRKKWIAEGRHLTTDAATVPAKSYQAKTPDFTLRAFLPEVQDAVKRKAPVLVE